MANFILAAAALPCNIEHLADDALIALCDEPEFLLNRTPLERELIVRLGAAIDAHRVIEDDLLLEIARLARFEPEGAKEGRQATARTKLLGLVAGAGEPDRAFVRVAS
ncbi:MAG: hypothetical protein M0Z73_05225 [Betaproteobacteria bacterium]|nr:hypothetical protein [Betaproteobacteria bacterium]